MNKKDGRQHKDGHRLGWVSAPMWARMQEYCEAFAISANDLTVRAIDNFLLEWEEEIVEDDRPSTKRP